MRQVGIENLASEHRDFRRLVDLQIPARRREIGEPQRAGLDQRAHPAHQVLIRAARRRALASPRQRDRRRSGRCGKSSESRVSVSVTELRKTPRMRVPVPRHGDVEVIERAGGDDHRFRSARARGRSRARRKSSASRRSPSSRSPRATSWADRRKRAAARSRGSARPCGGSARERPSFRRRPDWWEAVAPATDSSQMGSETVGGFAAGEQVEIEPDRKGDRLPLRSLRAPRGAACEQDQQGKNGGEARPHNGGGRRHA